MAMAVNRGARSDRNTGTEYDIGLDDHIRGDGGIMGKPDGIRGNQADAVGHRLFAPSDLPFGFDRGELGAAVDAGDLGRIIHLDHRALLPWQHHDIRKIIFPRGIVVADLVEQDEQVGRSRCHQAAVAQVYPAFRIAGILIFDHLLDFALVVGDDPAIGARVVGPEAEHHCAGVGAVVEPEDHLAHGIGADHRHIAVEDQDVARETL